MKILSVVGARPQFIKLAPVHKALLKAGLQHSVIHTGQHYDHKMSTAFFTEFDIPEPDLNLGVGSSTHAVQTAKIMESLEDHLQMISPDWVLVYGDTNSTLAAALVSVKMGIPIAHIEAGLRSHNRSMPEEHNRVLTDHCSELLFAPTSNAMKLLQAEGLSERSVLVGDVMIDVLKETKDSFDLDSLNVSAIVGVEGPFVLTTIHRQENTDNRERLSEILESLSKLPIPVVLAAHPRLVDRCKTFDLNLEKGSLKPVSPLGYTELIVSALTAEAIVTDSGGLQKEAYYLGVPCSTVRYETEWPETLYGGWNELVGNPGDLKESVGRSSPTMDRGLPFGNGNAAHAIVEILKGIGS